MLLLSSSCLSSLMSLLISFAALLIITIPTATAFTPPLEIFSFKFFDSSTGESVALKGIDYYPRPNAGELNNNNIDFYHDEYRHIWERDIVYLQQLGVNAIRLYGVDPGMNHDNFMCALQAAGIYVMVGLTATCPDCAISSVQSPFCYPASLKERGQYIINSFSKYDNTLAFSAGNEVGLVVPNPEWNAACQKKFLLDMRTFIQGCSEEQGMRKIPIGVVIADVDRVEKTDYYNCVTAADNELERAEWMGLNAYQHCNGLVTESDNAIGYQNIKQDYDAYSIPLLLTEYGCLNPSFPDQDGFQSQRTFNQARWMFEEDFRDVLAGGFVFEYSVERENSIVPFPFQEFGPGNFGIGYFASEFCTDIPEDQDDWCRYLQKPEFANLQEQYAATVHVGVENRDTFQVPANREGASECPAGWPALSDYTWAADSQADMWCTNAVTHQCDTVNVPDTTPAPSTSVLINSTASEPTVSPTMDGGDVSGPGGTAAPTTSPAPVQATMSPSDFPSDVPTITNNPTITGMPTAEDVMTPTVLPTSVDMGLSEAPSAANGTGSDGGSVSIRLRNFRVSVAGDEPDEVAFKNTFLTYLSDDFTKAFDGFLFMRLDILRTSRRRTRRMTTLEEEDSTTTTTVMRQQPQQQHEPEQPRDLQAILYEMDFFGTTTFQDDDSAPSADEVVAQQTVSLSNRTAIEAAMAENPDISSNTTLERVEYVQAQTSLAPTPAPPPASSGATTTVTGYRRCGWWSETTLTTTITSLLSLVTSLVLSN